MASSPPDDESFAPGDVEPRHLALKFDPPTLVLEYCRVSRHKLYHHRIRLKHLSRRSDVGKVVSKLLKRYPAFNSAKIPRAQLERLVSRLIERLPVPRTEPPIPGSPLVSPADPTTPSASDLDIGSPSPAAGGALEAGASARGGLLGALRRRRSDQNVKEAGNRAFVRPLSAPAIAPSSPLRSPQDSASPPPGPSALRLSVAGAGGGTAADAGHEGTNGGAAAAAPAPAPAPGSDAGGDGRTSPPAAAAPAAPTAAEDLGDLQRVSAISLRMAKARMEAGFEESQLKPGDPGYVYDKQVEFGDAEEPSGWDDESDEDDD